jgi:hypothetical protein
MGQDGGSGEGTDSAVAPGGKELRPPSGNKGSPTRKPQQQRATTSNRGGGGSRGICTIEKSRTQLNKDTLARLKTI